MSGKLESNVVARNTKKNIGGVLFTANLSQWNLGATRTTLNNSWANLLSSLCGNVAPAADQHPLGCPAIRSRENQLLRGRVPRQYCANLSLPFFLALTFSLLLWPHLPVARPKIDPDFRLMSPPGSLHHGEGAARRSGTRSCMSRRCHFPCDVPLTSKLALPHCCLCLISAVRCRDHRSSFKLQNSGVQATCANHSAKDTSPRIQGGWPIGGIVTGPSTVTSVHVKMQLACQPALLAR